MMRDLEADTFEEPRPLSQDSILEPIVGDVGTRAVTAWTWQFFPAKPHASHASSRLAGPERPVRAPAGDWLDPKRRRDQEIEEYFRKAPSLRIPTDLLLFENGATLLTAVIAVINSAIVQCMPSHRSHFALVKHAKRIRDRVAQFQYMERAQKPCDVDLPQETRAEPDEGDPLS